MREFSKLQSLRGQIKKINWNFIINGNQHIVELHVWQSSRKLKIFIDDELRLYKRMKIFRQDKVYLFNVDNTKIEIEIDDHFPLYESSQNDKLKYDCFIEGISLNTGSSPKSNQEKSFLRYEQEKIRWGQIYSQGYAKYMFKNLTVGLSISFLTAIVFAFFYMMNKNDFKVSLGIIIYFLIILLIFSQIPSLYEWRENNKKYIKNSKR